MSREKNWVLVVEDDADFAALIQTVLRRGNFQTAHAWNGRQALVILKSEVPPELIVTDLNMPLMGGNELCRELASDSRFREIPVVIYSSETNLGATARDLGAAGYASKIDPPAKLLAEVRRCCR